MGRYTFRLLSNVVLALDPFSLNSHLLNKFCKELLYRLINFINMTAKHNNNILNLITGCLYTPLQLRQS
jgi:hypothetical protein